VLYCVAVRFCLLLCVAVCLSATDTRQCAAHARKFAHHGCQCAHRLAKRLAAEGRGGGGGTARGEVEGGGWGGRGGRVRKSRRRRRRVRMMSRNSDVQKFFKIDVQKSKGCTR